MAKPQAEAGPIQQLLSSDEYWEGEYQSPLQVLGSAAIADGVDWRSKADDLHNDPTITRNIVNCMSALVENGGTYRPLEAGEALVFPTSPRQLLRVVSDSRRIQSSWEAYYSPLPSHVRQRRVLNILRRHNICDSEHFEANAAAMLSQQAYIGKPAITCFPLRGRGQMVLERQIHYAQAYVLPYFAAAVNGIGMLGSDMEPRPKLVMPANVGSLFRYQEDGTQVKIIAASILEANGTVWREARGNKRKPERTAKRIFVPGLANGLA